MKFKKEIFQIFSSAFFIVVLFLAVAWICIHYQNPQESLKEAISLTVSFMGVIATVIAALIAVLLFNDWKEQHNKQVQNNLSAQVFEAFSIFNRNVREYSLYITHLDGLMSSYDGCEVTWETLNTTGCTIYIQNIANKKDELDLNFYSLMDKLKTYYIFNENLDEYNKSYSQYFDKFIDINKEFLPTLTLTETKIDYEAKYLGYLDLKNIIEYLEIQKIINKLNA